MITAVISAPTSDCREPEPSGRRHLPGRAKNRPGGHQHQPRNDDRQRRACRSCVTFVRVRRVSRGFHRLPQSPFPEARTARRPMDHSRATKHGPSGVHAEDRTRRRIAATERSAAKRKRRMERRGSSAAGIRDWPWRVEAYVGDGENAVLGGDPPMTVSRTASEAARRVAALGTRWCPKTTSRAGNTPPTPLREAVGGVRSRGAVI